MDAQSIEIPAPRAATNGAIHYQRAILLLGAVDPDQRQVLQKPIWEIVTPESTEEELAEIGQLLVASRDAIRSALVGAEQMEADFGLDIRQYMLASNLPHADGMKEIGRLIALQGMQQQSQGDWKSAAETYLAGVRMGREMTHQATLTEAVAGIEILETMYFSLGQWAVRCPDLKLVETVAHIMDAMADDMVNPARTMLFEASISKSRLDAMEEAFPDGPWAEMVLEALGSAPGDVDAEGLRQAAIEAAAKRGVPREAFASKESFTNYMKKIRGTYAALARDSAVCLTLDPPQSIQSGQKTFAKYEKELPESERLSALNPARVAALFAVHQAELDILRQVLAVVATKTAAGYPATFAEAQGFLGEEPLTNPFDGGSYQYQQLGGGKGFSVKVDSANVGDIELPAINFRYIDAESTE